jgi:glutamate 5-kinase
LKSSKIKFGRIAVKVGSNVITTCDGSLNTGRMLRLVEQVAVLIKQGYEVILISSGAVAAGRTDFIPPKGTNLISCRQIWSALGQVKLMSNYQFLFGKYGIGAGQVLTTKESFRDRLHYLNMKNCITSMIENSVLPVINENDTISVNELMFTDNDELSGLIASMMDCRTLILLSNVDGIFTGPPGESDSQLITEIDPGFQEIDKYITSSKSQFGRGGMLTKYSIAREIAREGINVYIANGMRDSIITDIISEKNVPCTHILASDEKKNGVKKWLSHSQTFARGMVYINRGAREALISDRASSLLMVGVSKIEGFFKKGDIIRILDEKGRQIGLGKSQYDSEKAVTCTGSRQKKPLVHYDHLLINSKN